MSVKLPAVGLEQPAERLLVARLGGREQRALLACICRGVVLILGNIDRSGARNSSHAAAMS